MQFVFTLTLAVLSSTTVNAHPSGHGFVKPGPKDLRGPCPMINSLANHGFIPRSGRNVSINQIVNGIDEALNIETASTRPVVELALTTSTTGNPRTLHISDLSKHGVIEHDGSLSRNDIFLGDNHSFNPKIFAPVARTLFAKPTISIATAAKARRARLTAAAAANPAFNFTAREDQFSQFETALYLAVFGKGMEGNARSRWVEVLFREERLAYKEGFGRPTDVITNQDIVDLAAKVAAAA